MKYLLYKTDGSVDVIQTYNKMELPELQKMVGGNIEFAPSDKEDGSTLMCNEDGLGEMLPMNPFFKPKHQLFYVGNILMGKEVKSYDSEGKYDGIEFVGFDDDEAEKYMRTPLSYSKEMFAKNKVYTIISIGEAFGNTTCSRIKCTGDFTSSDQPIFKRNEKGSRQKFTLRNLTSNEALLFEGATLPFKVDGETGNVIRMNALINLSGNPEEIKNFIETKNVNKFFNAFDRINLCEGDKEILLYPESPTFSKMVEDRRANQKNNG